MLKCPCCDAPMSRKDSDANEYECSCGANLTLPFFAETLQLPPFPGYTAPEPEEWR